MPIRGWLRNHPQEPKPPFPDTAEEVACTAPKLR